MDKQTAVEGWVLFNQDGQVQKESGVHKSKESLLISYDLLPLRGLEQCESHLVSKGLVPTKVEVIKSNGESQGFAPTVNGIHDIDMMDYGAFSANRDAVLWSVAIYLGDEYKGRGVDRFGITEKERAALWAYVIFDTAKVKGTTRKKAREYIDTALSSILQRANIDIVGVAFKKCPKGKSAMSEWINGIKGCFGPFLWHPCLECRFQRDPSGCRHFRKTGDSSRMIPIEYEPCITEIAELQLNHFLRDNKWVGYNKIRIDVGV
jgi:hypothetical protein